jgi:hypothetical protein
MKTINRTVLCALFAVSASFASTTYTQSVPTSTSLSIPGTTHNLGCAQYGARIYDSNGVRQPGSAFTLTKNATTYTASFSFHHPFSGTVKLQGCFSPTSASTDFEATDSAGTITVCASCTDAAPAGREYASAWYVGTMAYTLTGNGDGQSGTAYVYLDPNTGHTVFGLTSSSGVGAASSGASVVYNSTGFPSGAVPLGIVTYSSSGFGSITDSRNFQ